MLASSILPLVATYWPVLLVLGLVGWLLNNKFAKGLNKYPGHWLAGYTDWWRFYDNLGRKTQHTHLELHRKYGDVVRLGPRVLSFADPKAIKVIYGLNKSEHCTLRH